MRRPVSGLAIALLVLAILTHQGWAQERNTARESVLLRVIGIAANDVLNVRELPGSDSRIVGVIPPRADNVEFAGAVEGGWVFVRYGSAEGWVSAKFLGSNISPLPRGRDLSE
jgi:uncharacterized protein YgiM (DUF1202 family)